MAQHSLGPGVGAGGDYNVSPASSIHRDRDARHAEDHPGFGHGDVDTPPTAHGSRAGTVEYESSRVVGAAPGNEEQWDVYGTSEGLPDEPPPWETTVPDRNLATAPRAFGGSLVQHELAEARARAALPGHGPTMTSYGPAPGDEIGPAPPVRNLSQPGQSSYDGGPFMHYEDITYLGAERDPKDELEMGGLSRNETLPSIPEGANSKARRSWDRQRNRRKTNAIVPGRDGGSAVRGASDIPSLERGGFGKHIIAWASEILWSLLSILCFAIIVAMLRMYDERGLPDWPLAVSLNTLVAFIEAICRVSLVVPLMEGLAQLKWNSFARGERPVSDLGTFEDVGRGPFGNARFVLKRKGRVMGMSAAVGLLTCFATSPLTQAAISYPTRLVAGTGIATAPRSELYSHPEYREFSNELDAREEQSIQQGIYHPVSEDLPPVHATCSSGDCQWPNFNSLAVCSSTADITDKLSITNQTISTVAGAGLGPSEPRGNELSFYNASLPSGAFLFGGTHTYNINISAPRFSAGGNQRTEENFLPTTASLAFSKLDGRVSGGIANIFIVYANQTERLDQEDLTFRAVEVLWHFCVNTYSVTVTRGISRTALVNSSTILSSSSTADPSTASVVLRALYDEKEYAVRRSDVRQLNSYISDLFRGSYSYTFGKGVAGATATSHAIGTAMFNGKAGTGLGLGYSEENVRAVIGNITRNVAVSLTNSIRSASASSTAASGTVLAAESYVHIEWPWLAFLAAQVVLSAVFLLGIMVQTAVWKVDVIKGSGSTMATLLALSATDRGRIEALAEAGGAQGGRVDMTRKVEGLFCRFELGERGWALALADRGSNGRGRAERPTG